MYPARFEYARPESLDQALELLGTDSDGAAILAGGQSLVPTMNLRLARPGRVVDINHLVELDFVRQEADGLVIGALTRHKTLLESAAVRQDCPLVSAAAAFIGHPQIRTLGTIGGSLAHADPASELPCVAL